MACSTGCLAAQGERLPPHQVNSLDFRGWAGTGRPTGSCNQNPLQHVEWALELIPKEGRTKVAYAGHRFE